MKGTYMKKSKYSSLSKQDLIEILEKIPDYIIYDYVREMCEKAFDERSEAYIQELKKIEQLKKEIQKKDYSERLDFMVSESKKAEDLFNKCEARYCKLEKLCESLVTAE